MSVESRPTDYLHKNGNPFDLIAQDYDAWFEGEGKLIFSIESHCLRELLPLLPAPRLEIGVGTGRFAEAIGIDCGLDPSARALAVIKSQDVNRVQAMGEKTPFIKGAFGTVALITTFCFISSGEKVLGEANRVLRHDGKIIMGQILKDSPWGKLYESKKAEGHPVYRTATFKSYENVVAMLEKAGFTIERVVSTLFQPPDAVKDFEYTREGYSAKAGFVAVLAGKSNNR